MSPFLFQSWNLLTRTSQSFEFVNVRLTVIWITGFFVRYFILLPGRALILIVGVSRYGSPYSSLTEAMDISPFEHIYTILEKPQIVLH